MRHREPLGQHIPYLRRYARALTGSQADGDALVRAALEVLAAKTGTPDAEDGSPVGLFRLFHRLWVEALSGEATVLGLKPPKSPEARLRALPAAGRAALLLTAVEGFGLSEASVILGIPPGEVERRALQAQHTLEAGMACKVLIIEDEPIIALDLESLLEELGHSVVARAARCEDAVAAASIHQPGLILADVDLGEGGSGIEAVRTILTRFDLPVIFITAYPEKLLTGEGPEPAYLIAKPFQPETVQATVGQALFLHEARRKET